MLQMKSAMVFGRHAPYMMLRLSFFGILTLATSGCSFTGAEDQRTTEQPNVIFILTDDQGTVDLGVYGTEDILTPNLDSLAGKGILFTQFYAGGPICSASRASILTGKIPIRAGVPGNVGSSAAAKKGMPSKEITIAEILKEEGYKTAAIGKWHLGYQPDQIPTGQGFDYHFGHLVGCIDNYSHFFYWNGPNRHDLYRNGKEIHLPGRYFPDLMVEEASRFMEDNRSEPFFLYFAMNTPHYPYQGDPEWLEYYNEQEVPYPRNIYNAFVSTMDERIGRLLKKVDQLGLAQNTIVIFQSDHGHSTEERAHFGGGSAGPYRGAKASLFEGGIRVPAIISWPGQIPAGERRNQLAVAPDWLPTIAEIVGAAAPEHPIDGKSLTAVIQSADAPENHKSFYWTFGRHWAVRKGDWKLLFDPLDTSEKRQAPPNSAEDLYFLVKLSQDPGERTNLAQADPAKVRELKQAYESQSLQ